MSIRILLVDDHKMFREGLRAILERDSEMAVVAEASDGRQALALAAASPGPNVVIMDIGMPSLNGVDATTHIVAKHPRVKVIALSTHTDRRYVAAMLDAGASGYVLKECAGEEIRRAVRAVHDGHTYLTPEISGSIIAGYLGQQPIPNPVTGRTSLASREREVVQLLAEGKTSKDVASLLRISVKTVETHRRNIMAKLNLRSVAALTKFAIREGLTSTEA